MENRNRPIESYGMIKDSKYKCNYYCINKSIFFHMLLTKGGLHNDI